MKFFKFIDKFLDEHIIEVAKTVYVLLYIFVIILGIWGIANRDNMHQCACEKCSYHMEERMRHEGE